MKNAKFLWASFKYNLNFIGSRNKLKKRSLASKIAFGFLFAFLFIYLVGMSAGLSFLAAEFLQPIGLIELLPTLFFVLVSLLMLITSIFSSQSYLYKAKDVEILSALPLSNRVVLISKLLTMYFYDLIFALIFLVPSTVFYFVYAGFSLEGLIAFILITVLSPVLPSAVGVAISYFVGRIISRIKFKNVFIILLSLGAFFGYQYAISHFGSVVEYFTENAQSLNSQLGRYYPPAQLYSEGVSGNLLSALLLIVLSIAVGVLLVLLIAPYYSRICANFKLSAKGKSFSFSKNEKDDQIKASGSEMSALYKREFTHFISSPTYFLNTGIMFLIISIMCFVSLFAQREVFVQLLNIPFANEFITPIMCAFLCIGVGSVYSTSVSISAEGKTLWIYKALPVKEQRVFWAKILVCLTITLPILVIDAFVLFIALELGVVDLLLLLIVPAVYGVFTAAGGLLLNLLMPKLDYPNEVMAVKQSATAFIGMFSGMTLPILACLIAYLLGITKLLAYLCAVTAILLIFAIGFIYLLNTWGVKKFRSL